MTPLQALAFFVREALVSLRRSWKVAALAVVTIAVSLFIGGVFWLLTSNLTRIVHQWRQEARIVVYLEVEPPEPAEAAEAAPERLRKSIEAVAWVTGVELVESAHAEERFREAFPNLGDLLVGWEDGGSLPASLEVAYDPDAVADAELRRWQRELASDPAVAMVDDDRLWLRQVERLIALLRTVGLLLGIVLLTAAVFTISSVIRLAAYLYREEIAVLRLVGATEFMIRGPFLVEGLIQGFLGALVSLAGLLLCFRLVGSQALPSIFGSVLFDRFLTPSAALTIVAVGSLAGLLGSVLSMRREKRGLFA